jgi:DedD protein
MFKQKRDSAPDKPRIEPADAVQQARTRARQRLIGAIVLLAIGIIGFPLVFETQPRPIPVDVPIEIPRRDALPPLVMPPPRPTATRPAVPTSEAAATTDTTTPGAATTRTTPAAARGSDGAITESGGDTARDSIASRVTAHASSPVETPRRAASAAVVAVAPASATTRSADGERARALLEARPASSADEQRFVVQVGAFADAEAARETRKNVEKLGFKTYTQVAQTSAGNRIRVRVGPFTTRGEAEAALAKAKAAGMNAVLLTL